VRWKFAKWALAFSGSATVARTAPASASERTQGLNRVAKHIGVVPFVLAQSYLGEVMHVWMWNQCHQLLVMPSYAFIDWCICERFHLHARSQARRAHAVAYGRYPGLLVSFWRQ